MQMISAVRALPTVWGSSGEEPLVCGGWAETEVTCPERLLCPKHSSCGYTAEMDEVCAQGGFLVLRWSQRKKCNIDQVIDSLEAPRRGLRHSPHSYKPIDKYILQGWVTK